MKCLERNKQRFFYSTYQGKVPMIDEYGNETGEYKIVYSEPLQHNGNISPAQGDIATRQFGDSENYDKVIVISDIACPIDANSVLWVDNLDIHISHDYIVRKVAKSLNGISYAISKVNIGG